MVPWRGVSHHPDVHGLDHLIPDCRSSREAVFADHDRALLSDVVTTVFDIAQPATAARAVPSAVSATVPACL
ncbi:hypothetical protein [Saccharomonospora cyanea]|uniref:hypothetical protein n=1 Tax=Saccharomonospora cyanea TaxID=40989 RepID=UPI0002FBD5BA|nr:hypothetical protein [Saccharomonospora cyanea]